MRKIKCINKKFQRSTWNCWNCRNFRNDHSGSDLNGVCTVNSAEIGNCFGKFCQNLIPRQEIIDCHPTMPCAKHCTAMPKGYAVMDENGVISRVAYKIYANMQLEAEKVESGLSTQ